MNPRPAGTSDERVLLLAPTARDAAASWDLLTAAGLRCLVCSGVEEICRELPRGAGAAVLPAEAVLNDGAGCLADTLRAQPPWSDYPLIVLTPAGALAPAALRALHAVGHMTFLKRPVEVAGFVSAVQAALRDRRRQYAVRDLLADREARAEALRQAEEHLRLMVESAVDYAIYSTDVDGRVTRWNRGAERVFGWPEAEIVGRDGGLLFTPEDRAAGVPLREQVKARDEGRAEDERWHLRKDGTRFFASGVLTPLRDGALRGYIKVARDVTTLRQMQAALRAANDELEHRVEERTAELRAANDRALQSERLAAIGEMVAGLSHESRNALQRSHACLEMLRTQVEDRPRALELIDRLRLAQSHLRQIYEAVGNYAAPIPLRREPCDLGLVWREAWDNLDRARQGREASLHEKCGDLDLRCVADPFRLGQVFRNLFENALAACPDPVVITVTCTAARLAGRDAVRAAVRDNGPGLNEEQRRRMFDPFYTTKTRGTGLGLPITRRIVEAHGGRIEPGAAEGPGAEIVITLPRGDAAGPVVPPGAMGGTP